MNPLWTQIVIQSVLRNKKKSESETSGVYSSFALAKGYRVLRITIFRAIKDIILVTLGIFSAAFGLKGFLLTNNFIDGGAMGISLLISALSPVPLYLLIFIVNLPFIVLGYHILGKSFVIKTGIAIMGLALVVATVSFPDVTKDNLLVAVFGGFFLGAGIGLSIRGGAVIDGTEIFAIYISKKVGATVGDIILIVNVLIFSVAAWLLSVEIALYSLLTYLAASKTLDFIIEGIEEYHGVTIVTAHSEEIRIMIIEQMGKGVTVYNGKRGYGKLGETRDTEIIYTVVTRLELNKLNTAIEKIDPNAFVVTTSLKDTKGGMIKKRPLKY
ncbi:MAG: YitT family protein [Bacteroidales bacterium]|nr:YitT family protein [Bacteroidales bacterium]